MKVIVLVFCLGVVKVYSASLPRHVSKRHEPLFNKLEDYKLVRPYRSTSDGDFLTYDLSVHKRSKRSTGGNEDENVHFAIDGFHDMLNLNLTKSTELFSPLFEIDYYGRNGQLVDIEQPVLDCVYQGSVDGESESVVAISTCEGLSGVIMSGNEEYIVEPLDPSHDAIEADYNDQGTHVLYRAQDNTDINDVLLRDDGKASQYKDSPPPIHDNMADELDSVMSKRSTRRQKRSAGSTTRFVEVMLVVDTSVNEFHGEALPTYVATMFNIMNVAFKHPSLGAQMKFVLAKMKVLDQTQSDAILISNDAGRTIKNFYIWQERQRPEDPLSPEQHDLAIYLTRRPFGPAGYAPVGEMCSRSYSVALVKDGGLLSSYVMAHEAGHTMGLTHDTDQEGDIHCPSDASKGSIMAPIVRTTYHNYFWSQCSNKDLSKTIETFSCLRNDPFLMAAAAPTEKSLPAGLMYTLNEQCEFEFGRGSVTCNRIGDASYCTELWCLKPPGVDPNRNCFTKYGSPIDGSMCGTGMWCMGGNCEVAEGRLDGAWSQWSPWTECSFPCEVGIRSRTRKCDDPQPLNGGKDCKGKDYEWELCNTFPCPETPDRRAEQCYNNLLNWEYLGRVHTWFPYHNRDRESQCKLMCVSEDTGDVVISPYDVTDGTACNYDQPNDVCIRGQCVPIGCDRSSSKIKTLDNCGVCGGDDSSCIHVVDSIKFMPKKEGKYKRLAKIPAGARNLEVEEVTQSSNFLALRDGAKGGEHFLNGDQEIPWSRDVIFGNARYVYAEYNPERISSKGPVSTELQLQAYIFNVDQIVDVRWSYYIQGSPVESVKPSFTWVQTEWSQCSASCGGGISQAIFECRRSSDNSTADESECQAGDEQDVTKPCNEEGCVESYYRWFSKAWGDCSLTCGGEGLKTRTVTCKNVIRVGGAVSNTVAVDDGLCDEDEKPKTSKTCSSDPCEADWMTSPWSECSATCGEATRTRIVYCNTQCNGEMPSTEEECNLATCPLSDCVPQSEIFCSMMAAGSSCDLPGFSEFCCVDCD